MAAKLRFTFKVLVAGPFSSGKTTLISAVSQTPVVSTEVSTSGAEAAVKERTTVAMDFGTYELADDRCSVKLLLFGGPGQKRLGFMTDILKTDADVVIFVVTPEADVVGAAEMLAELNDRLQAPLLVAVNRCDDQEIAGRLAGELGVESSVLVLACQLVDRAHSINIMVAALELLDSQLVGVAR